MSVRKRRAKAAQSSGGVSTGFAWYRREQWALLREVSSDADRLEEEYDEWLQGAERLLDDLRNRGLRIKPVDVDVEKLLTWCRATGRPVDAGSRSEFVAQKLRWSAGASGEEPGG